MVIGVADGLEGVVEAVAAGELVLDSEASPSGVVPWVAPRRLASSSLDSRRSTATISAAPATRAPWMAEMPTPPQPNTTTVEPGSTLAVLMAAPTPVMTPQPISEAISSGTEASIGTTACCGQDDLLGEGPGAGEPEDRLAVDAEVRGHDRVDLDGRAQVRRLAVDAEGAQPAGRAPGHDDVVAHLDVGDALADLGDHPCALVARAPPAPAAGWCRSSPRGPSGTRRWRRS